MMIWIDFIIAYHNYMKTMTVLKCSMTCTCRSSGSRRRNQVRSISTAHAQTLATFTTSCWSDSQFRAPLILICRCCRPHVLRGSYKDPVYALNRVDNEGNDLDYKWVELTIFSWKMALTHYTNPNPSVRWEVKTPISRDIGMWAYLDIECFFPSGKH